MSDDLISVSHPTDQERVYVKVNCPVAKDEAPLIEALSLFPGLQVNCMADWRGPAKDWAQQCYPFVRVVVQTDEAKETLRILNTLVDAFAMNRVAVQICSDYETVENCVNVQMPGEDRPTRAVLWLNLTDSARLTRIIRQVGPPAPDHLLESPNEPR